MSIETDDKPNVTLHPPSVFLGAIVVGFCLRLLFGGGLWLSGFVAEALGLILCLGGISVLVRAVSGFAGAGETVQPATPSAALLTDGLYAFTRNPMYLGMATTGLGLAVATENFWMIATVFGAAALINYRVIPEEEAYLERAFGADYRAYKGRVRRWV